MRTEAESAAEAPRASALVRSDAPASASDCSGPAAPTGRHPWVRVGSTPRLRHGSALGQGDPACIPPRPSPWGTCCPDHGISRPTKSHTPSSAVTRSPPPLFRPMRPSAACAGRTGRTRRTDATSARSTPSRRDRADGAEIFRPRDLEARSEQRRRNGLPHARPRAYGHRRNHERRSTLA